MKQTPLEKVYTDANAVASASKHGLSKEIIDFDKKFFQRQLDRLAKTYQTELRANQSRAREKAIEYVEKNMYMAKEALQNEIQLILK